jgi:hypothetical protein
MSCRTLTSIRLRPCDKRDVAEAVGVQLHHRSEICGELPLWRDSGAAKRISGERSRPDYERCVIAAPRSKEGQGPDRSMADFFWCLMAAQRGHAIEDIAARLLEVSSKARGRTRLHDEGYALVTAQNAAAAAERGRKRGRG